MTVQSDFSRPEGQAQWWCAPSAPITKPVPLQAIGDWLPGSTAMESGQALTLRLHGCMIPTLFDDANKRLVIVTSFQVANYPAIKRLHYVAETVKAGWQERFFDDVILAIRDFPLSDLRCHIQIYAVVGLSDEFIRDAQQLSYDTTLTFPILSQYENEVSILTRCLTYLVRNLNEHDRILDTQLTFRIADLTGQPNDAVMQPAYFVAFSESVEGDMGFDQDFHIRPGTHAQEMSDVSYAVIELAQEYRSYRRQELDQNLAQFVAQVEQATCNGLGGLNILRHLLDGYQRYQSLLRAVALLNKRRETSLGKAEAILLEELIDDPDLNVFLRHLAEDRP